jgi:hypothetical protein
VIRSQFLSYCIIKVKTGPMKRNPGIALLLVIVLFQSACEPEKDLEPEIHYIGYGTSFGECLGYCIHELKLDRTLASLTQSGWDMQGSLPVTDCSRTLQSGEFKAISESINLPCFFGLSPIIGCPDCNDGGSEWVEISYDTIVFRVTFEYLSEPQELAALVPRLRDMMNSIPGCEE